MLEIALPHVVSTQNKAFMNNDTTIQTVLFKELSAKPVIASFDQPDSSSDGGALLLKACDKQLGLSEALAKCLVDSRQTGKIAHSLHDLLRQRIYSLACGYEDCNDAARLSADPMQRLLLDRDPVQGADVASQPTLSRFENSISSRELLRMSYALCDCVLERHRRRLKKRVKLITLDMDPTDDACHGQQQLSFFNRHYDNWCYLPMGCFVQFDNEPDQYLLAHVLRGGDAHATTGATSILGRLIVRIREHFPGVKIRVRLDGGFGSVDVLDFLDVQGVEYVVGLPPNAVLKDFAEPLQNKVRWLSYRSGTTQRRFGECRYSARSWETERRVIYKCEVLRVGEHDARDNPRFVVTNVRHTPASVYEKIYCQRANVENRLKEMQYGLSIDRTSCTRFFANQLRVILTAAAYALMQELRLQAKGTSCEGAQVDTLRLRLLKLGVWFKRSVRRLILHLPENAPWRSDWCRIARRLGAVPT